MGVRVPPLAVYNFILLKMKNIKIKIEGKDIGKQMDNLAKEWRKDTIIPGFRKGRAPVEIVRSRLRDKLREESLQQLIQENLLSIVDKYAPFIYSPPQIQNLNETEDNVEFDALVDVPPDLEIDFSKIKLDKEDMIMDVDISGELKRLQEINSELKSVNRPIKKGDVVFIDIKTKEESLANYYLNINDNSISKRIIGLKGGDEKKINLEFPKDFPIEKLRGKKRKADIKIIEVKKKILPKLNDEFAKDLGFNNLEELKSNLKEGIGKELEQKQKDIMVKKVLQKVLKLMEDIEVSPSVVESKKREGLSAEEALNYSKEIMLIDAIALKEGFKVEEKELDEWMEKISESEDTEFDEIGDEAISIIKLQILRKKALDFLLEKAKEGVVKNE
jgi:trigger factor